MKMLSFFCVLLFLGCSSSPPKPPEPEGKMVLVNPVDMKLDKLIESNNRGYINVIDK